jgi:UDP-glucose 4-epimerase
MDEYRSQKVLITGGVGSVYSSAAKFNFATGWRARVPIEEGIVRTVEYYKQHREHYW